MPTDPPHRLRERYRSQKNVTAKHSHLYIVKDRGETSEWKDELANWFAPVNFYVYLWQPVRLRNYFQTRHFFEVAF